jgi:ribokinase
VAKAFDILAVGYACVDYITVVDRLPNLDEKMVVDNLLIQGGGPSATAMVAAARLGARTALVTSLADDPLGREIVAELEREGVDVSLTPLRTAGNSAFAFAMIQRNGGLRTIVGRPATVEHLTGADLPVETIAKAKVLFIDGNEPEAQLAAAKAAREAGVPVIFDAGNEKAGMEELIPFTDVLIASHGFGRDAGGSDDPAVAAKAFFARGSLTVSAVTAGARGAYFHTSEGAFHQPIFKVNVVDTTGAGDAFHGAYAYAMVKRWPVKRAARFAAAVAAMKCTKLGGRTGLPRLAAVEAFLAERSAGG